MVTSPKDPNAKQIGLGDVVTLHYDIFWERDQLVYSTRDNESVMQGYDIA